jgi:hypothetical protein
MNKTGSAALIAAAIMSAQTTAHAETCGDQIAALQKVADATKVHRFVGPTENQTVGAQLHHEPTPASIAAAENNAAERVNAVLARAKALSAAGKEAECLKSVGEAKLLLNVE